MTAETRVLVFVRPEVYEMLKADDVATDSGDYLEIPAGDRVFFEVRTE